MIHQTSNLLTRRLRAITSHHINNRNNRLFNRFAPQKTIPSEHHSGLANLCRLNPILQSSPLACRSFSSTPSNFMKFHLHLIGTSGAKDASPSVLLFSDNARYLFNCGECTQRLITEHKAKTNRFEAIFLAKTHSDNFGGIPGFLLTAADSGAQSLKLYGAPNLTHALASTRHYVMKVGMDVEVHELTPSSAPYKDSAVTVYAAHVLPVTDKGYVPNTETCEALEVHDPDLSNKLDLIESFFKHELGKRKPSPTREEVIANLSGCIKNTPKRAKVRAPDHYLMKRPLPPAYPRAVAISYICHTADALGKFDPIAAKALGLRPGKIFAELKRGNCITTPKGEVIRPEQCVGPPTKGAIFIVIDCPNVDYIPGLVGHPKFQNYKVGQEHEVSTIIHNTGASVILNKDYLEFMKSFGPNTQHIINSSDVCSSSLNFLRSAQSLLALSLIDDEVFAIPYHTSSASVDHQQIAKDYDIKIAPAVPRAIIKISDNSQVVLPPESTFLPLSDDKSAVRMGLQTMTSYTKSLDNLNRIPPARTAGPFVSTLGTGSAIPSLLRNVSSNLVTLPSGNMLLLDTGEGTLGQLYRHLGVAPYRHPKLNANLQDFYDRLTFIYISHPHADHHLGILQILQEVYRNTTTVKRRYLIMPRSLYTWLCEFAQVQDIGLHLWQFIPAYELTSEDFFFRNHADMEDMKNIRTCRVNHCQEAFGVSFEFSDGFKLVYSGDTRPCQSLVDIGMNADVLIHEATMEDELIQDAMQKRHSTISEALAQGDHMKARQVILTHFSQRYPGCTFATSKGMRRPVAVAFDLMCLDVGIPQEGAQSDISRFQSFYKPLKKFFYTDLLTEDVSVIF